MSQSSDNLFHITVATYPARNVDLSHELQLLKAAMLYADRVKFCSPASSMLITVLQLGHLSTEELVNLFAAATNNDELKKSMEVYRGIKNKKHRNSNEIIAVKKLEAGFKEAKKTADQYFERLIDQSGMDKLIRAVQSQIVELELLNGVNSQDMVKQYVQIIGDALRSEKTYPLFDDRIGKLAEAATREGVIVLGDTSKLRAKQTGLSSNLFHRLPLFEKASIDEILDIRKELEKALINFRAGIIKFTKEIENAPWEEDFPQEADLIFRQYVQPGILELEDATKSNNFLLNLVPKAVISGGISSSFLGFLLSQASHLPGIITAATVIAGSAVLTLEAIKEWREKNQQIQSNHLYFYYKAGQKLS
jgi:hypothetical protein